MKDGDGGIAFILLENPTFLHSLLREKMVPIGLES